MIYFIRQNEQVKIGCTSNIHTRLNDLQVASPYDLSVALLIPGDFSHEQYLHELFESSRIRGEWYMLTEEVKKFISDNYSADLRYDYGLLDQDGLDEKVQTQLVRNMKSLTLREVGEKLNITPQSVKEIETRELHGTVSINVLKRYAEAMGYTLVYKFVLNKEEK